MEEQAMANKYRILITGASSGFGKLAAISLAGQGHQVFAGMRSPEGRNAAARDELLARGNGHSGSLEVVELDVTNDASVGKAVAVVEQKAGGLDVVVNNAGIAGMGMTESFTPEQAQAMFDVNVVGVHRVNRATLPLMRKSGTNGLLIHVSSVLGRVTVPFMGIYVASKFAVEALAECYRYELNLFGIESVIVQPGTYPTNIMSNLVEPADTTRDAAYGPLPGQAAGMKAGIAGLSKMENAPNPQDVADAIVNLVAAAPGTRPARVVVDAQSGGLAKAVNEACANVQEQFFGAMGMAALLHPKTSQENG
jgi:NAD(P)-dependent dehydrogenase (short-subunit alcohol dehydrogenase family)